MYRLRIIALHVISTLYIVLCSDSRSGHFIQLCTHARHEYQFLGILWIFWPLYVYTKQLTHFLLRESAADCISFIQKFVATQRPVQSPFHSAKSCCYRKSLLEGVLRIRIFLMCIPLIKNKLSQQTNSMTETLHSTWSCSQNTGAPYFDCRNIYYY